MLFQADFKLTMLATLPLLQESDFPPLARQQLSILQINLGYRCNQSCLHCHVNAGPNRTETMDEATMALIPKVLLARSVNTLDLTGGAPEIHPGFRSLVRQANKMGVKVLDRCNLTVFYEPGQEDTAEFLASQQVEIIASLPCYSEQNVDEQRGKGVFEKSVEALQRLNSLGYGMDASGLKLNLVYNPQGPSLPPSQVALEAEYKRELKEHYGIIFNDLFVLTNMPIQRFGSTLRSKNQFAAYMSLLKQNFTPGNLENVMCRSLVNVDWQGYLYDCDFNQQLGLPLGSEAVEADKTSSAKFHLRDLLDDGLEGNPIQIADHCFGCTAGQGSSCGGAL